MDSTHGALNYRTTERWNTVTVPKRVARRAYENVDKRADGCWISRYSTASHGYSQIGWQENGGRWVVLGHRAAWVHINGQMPMGVTLDHLCKERRCVNPGHLRILPNYENARRVDGKDWPMGSCANGHPNSLRTHVSMVPNKRGGRRQSLHCAPCMALYASRGNWRHRHPGEPMPPHLLLAFEKAD